MAITLSATLRSRFEVPVGKGGQRPMVVTIRELEDSPGQYFAYSKTVCGKGSYFAYFGDDIFGAMVLVDFVQMLRSHFAAQSVEVKLLERSIRPKNRVLLDVLRAVTDGGEGPGT